MKRGRRPHPIALGRLAGAGVALLMLWLLAWFTFLVGVLAMMPDVDGGRDGDAGRPVGLACFVAAAVLFLGSGFVAYCIAPTRVMLAAPAMLIVLAGLGVLVAVVT